MRSQRAALSVGTERNHWLRQRLLDADAILSHDGEAAWDWVRLELENRRYLTADEVRALVAQSGSDADARAS
jgi:hypothetical protein